MACDGGDHEFSNRSMIIDCDCVFVLAVRENSLINHPSSCYVVSDSLRQITTTQFPFYPYLEMKFNSKWKPGWESFVSMNLKSIFLFMQFVVIIFQTPEMLRMSFVDNLDSDGGKSLLNGIF